MRVQMRLYEELENDAVVMDWIQSLPTDNRGRRRVKQQIVSMLADAIRRSSKPRSRQTQRARAKDVPSKNGKESLRKAEMQLPVVPVRNGKEVDVNELPDHPPVEKIQF